MNNFLLYSCLLTSSLLLLSSNATRWLCTYFRRTITMSSLVMERARMNLRVPATKAALLYRMRVELLCNKIDLYSSCTISINYIFSLPFFSSSR